jgi:hypothetical protein
MSETTPPPDAGRPIDHWLVERLTADPTAARDDDERALADLFAALRAPADEAELAERRDYLAAFAAAQAATAGSASTQTLGPDSAPTRRTSMLGTFLATKTVVAAVALGTLGTATAAAAFTGTLPDALQKVAHDTVGAPTSHRPEPKPTPTPSGTPSDKAHAKPGATPSGTGKGPDAKGSAAYGLCTAYTHGGLATTSTAYRNLATAAGGSTKISAYCATVPHPGSTKNQSGQSQGDSTGKPTDKPNPHSTGKPSDHPTGSPTSHSTGSPTSHPGGGRSTAAPGGSPTR